MSLARQPLVVPFAKMDGAGNDFIVLDSRFLRFDRAELEALARRFCPRRTGVGADGLLALDPPAAGSDAHLRMRYHNADGSLGTMCGNGARCLARFAVRGGLGEPQGGGAALVRMDTDGGRYEAVVAPESAPGAGPVRLAVPDARGIGPLALADPPPEAPAELLQAWTGTEHVVAFVPELDAAPVATLGPAIRHDAALAPTGANVNFAEVVGGAGATARVRARTFEKGVEAETLACGTGAVAVALAARQTGRVAADRVEIAMPGGTLTVAWTMGADGPTALTLEGPATLVYEGTLSWWGLE